jgi:LPXTG-motif cell wall anchor domain protein
MKKQLIATTAIATVSLVGTIGTAHADTTKIPLPTDARTEPALVEKEAPKKVEVKTPTKEEVAELGAIANQTQEDADKAKEVLDQANEKSDKAEKKVTDLKQAQADAQKTADKATPEVIENAEKKVDTAKANVPTTEQAVSTAQTEKDDADRNVAIQGKTVGTKQAEVTQAENGVTDAKASVKSAEDALNGVHLGDAKRSQEQAIKEESDSKQAQADAQKALDEAKKLDGELAEQLNQTKALVGETTKSIKTNKAELAVAKGELEKADAQHKSAVSALNDAQEKAKGTKLTLAPDFVQAVKDTIAYNLADNSALSAEERNKRTTELYNRVVRTQVANANNKYVQTKNELEDTTRYDINNLPKEIRDELNYFVADLLNQARKQLGLPDAVLSKTSLEFAQKIADEYVKANYSNSMRQEYRKKGGSGHYAKGINKVAKEYGMPTTDSEVEARGGQYYENSVTTFASHDFDDEDGVYRKTLGEMKETLYNHFVQLISTKNDYAHTQGVLQFDSPSETAYFGGVAQSKTDDFYTTHFLTSVRSSLTKGSTWDTTPIENPMSATNLAKKVETARTNLSDAISVRKDAQNRVATLETDAKNLEDTLKRANSTLETLKKGESPLANAQKTFDEAKARHDKAVVTLANANALVNNLTASKTTKEETLTQAQAKLKDAEKALQTAQDALKAEETKMKELEAVATNKAQAVSTAKKALQAAQDEVKQAEKELADLKGAKARLNEVKAELEQAEKALQGAYKAQNKAKVDYEVKSLAADQAKTAYETAKVKFEEAETKRLVALADAKRKELEHLGYKPVPVVDGKGNVVDYKAEKVTVGTKEDKTYHAPAKATNAKVEPKKQLPNTGTKESNLLAVLGASIGLLALVGKRKYNR